MAARIKSGEKTHVPRVNAGAPESKETTHICVADEHGNVVNMTHSLGSSSGVVSEGLGFMYNNCMMVFDPRPGYPGSLAPGKARFSAMCPTTVFKDGAALPRSRGARRHHDNDGCAAEPSSTWWTSE